MTLKTGASSSTTLHIENMVCNRCIKVVREELKKLGHDVRSIALGEAVIAGEPDATGVRKIKAMLEREGFALIEDQRVRTIEQIKHVILRLVRRDAEKDPLVEKFSEYIAREVGADYHSLSRLFTSVENVTIEHFIVLQRIERAKELLKYGELTLNEISYKLGYSSVQHLSGQFKQITGITPSRFRKMRDNARQPLDRIA
jgi:AraC family transcriptional regulator